MNIHMTGIAGYIITIYLFLSRRSYGWSSDTGCRFQTC